MALRMRLRWAAWWEASWITVPEICRARTLAPKQIQSGQSSSQYPQTDRVIRPIAVKNIQILGLNPAGAFRYSLGMVSITSADCIVIFAPCNPWLA